MYLSSNGTAQLTHDEHETITLPEGTFRVLRQRQLEEGCGMPMDVLGVLEDGAEYEERLHTVWEDRRVFGEWFVPNAEILRVAAEPACIPDFLAGAEKALRRGGIFFRTRPRTRGKRRQAIASRIRAYLREVPNG